MDARKARALHDMGFTVWVRRSDAAVEAAVPGSIGSGDSSERIIALATDTTTARGNEPVGGTASAPDIPRATDESPDWAALEAAVAACTRCALAGGRKRTVFGVGARDARWLLVGEAPGAEEDRRGEPFVGRAGKLLDAMLAALGLGRDEVFITNIVKCRPPGNRDPKPEEAASCRGYLDRQIEWVAPKLILALGRVAAQQLLGVEAPVGRMRGRAHEGPNGVPVVVTYHPAYLLRTPIAKRKVWEDLKLALATVAPRAS
ncbi:MAG: uracil-DNA glycosylase [Gammaproteobacteria bacterium]